MPKKKAVTGKPEFPVKITAKTNDILDGILYSNLREYKSDSIAYAVGLLETALKNAPGLTVKEAVGAVEKLIEDKECYLR